eukprot:jgi/Mesvir1/22764/Mv14157-RA.5
MAIRYLNTHRYWWLLLTGLFFAAYDAYGIGANDVANSFANAVAARTLTMYQACGIAAIAEFVGSVALGQEVTDTLKGKVLSATVFNNQFIVLPLMKRRFDKLPDKPSDVPIVASEEVAIKVPAGDASETASEASVTASQHQSKFHPLQQSYRKVKMALLSGMQHDTVSVSADVKHLATMHQIVQRYDNKTELVFSWIQVLTCTFAALSHGANDVANAVGPLAGIFEVWDHGGSKPPKKGAVKKWILAYGGFFIVVGLATRGWYIMAALGNNMTPITPSRGFAMELGAVTAVLIATIRGLPVSTTQCITGGVLAVGLCNGNLAAVNWRMIAWTVFSWILTLPFAGIFSGLLFAFVAYSPHALDCSDKISVNGVLYAACRPRPYGFQWAPEFANYTVKSVDL